MTEFVLYTYEFFKLKSKRSALIVFALFCFNLVSKLRKQHIQRVWNCVVTRHSAAMASVSITKPPLLQRFGANAQCRQNCGSASAVWPQGLEMQLSDCKTVSLSDFQTVGLIDCLSVWLSECQTVRLSNYQKNFKHWIFNMFTCSNSIPQFCARHMYHGIDYEHVHMLTIQSVWNSSDW